MAIVFIQDFQIQVGDTSTKNYDAVVDGLDLQGTPEGLIIHTAGFDKDAGVFRVMDVWESREAGEKFINERLNPVIERLAGAAAESGDTTFTPPDRETWYELHHTVPEYD